MRFGIRQRLELLGFSLVKGCVNRASACLGLPVLHCLLRGDYFYLLALEFKKTHKPAEALLVKAPHRNLIGMVAGWAEELSGGAAAGDTREISLRRLSREDLLFVVLCPKIAESVPFQQGRVESNWAVLQLVQWVGRVLGGDPSDVPLRLLQKHAGSPKERISLGALPDLARNVGRRVWLWKKLDADFGGKLVCWRPRSPLLGALVVRPVPLVAARPALRS